MYEQKEKPKAKQQKAVNQPVAQKKNTTTQRLGMESNPLGAIVQRHQQPLTKNTLVPPLSALHDMSSYNQPARQAAQLQDIANNNTSQQQASEIPGQAIQKKQNNTGLPDELKSGIESLSGYSMDDVKVHYNSDKPAQLQAHAYAQGNEIHLASGQEKHLPHEAWHVVQQKQGRVNPTVQMKETVHVNDDNKLEKEADVMGTKAMQFKRFDRVRAALLRTPFSSSTVQRREVHTDVQGLLRTDDLNRDEIIAIYKQLKRTNGNKKTIEELREAMLNNEYKGEPIDPGLLNDWDDPKDYLDEEPQGRTDLSALSAPIIKSLGDKQFQLQDEIMNHFNKLIETEGEGTIRKDVFRLCTVEIDKLTKEETHLTLREPVLKIPSGLAPGYRFVSGNKPLIRAIEEHVFTILRTSGQLEYIRNNELLNSKWRIIVDVDYYYNRPPAAVGFHKDTVGRSMFVNLNFNNQSEIVGPEFILNPKPIKEHDEHIADKLPQPFLDDLMKERRRLEQPQEIQSTRIPTKGMVSFVDELIHHTTPFKGHRSFSNAELQTIARKMKAAKRLGTLMRGTLPAKINDRQFLEDEIGLDQDLLNFLFSHRNMNGSTVTGLTTENLKQILSNDQRYLKMQQLLPYEANIPKLDELADNERVYSHQDLVVGGLAENFISFLYNEHEKYDLQFVSLAGCEDQCDINTESKSFPLVDDGQPRLKRQMSRDLLEENLPPPTENKRQFFRTWVQAIQRDD